MAQPSRLRPVEQDTVDPRTIDPVNPIPMTDPVTEERLRAANSDARAEDRAIIENQTRGAGSGVYIAAIVVALAALAYFFLAPASNTPAPGDPPAATEPSAPATPSAPAPDATAPAAPATPAQPAPEATQPTQPAPAPAAPSNSGG